LPDEYRQLDLLVVPSLPTKAWTEQFGRVVVEAMAAGTPVLASRCGELPVVVGEAGALVDPGDASALRSTIESLLEQPDVLQAMADEGLRRAADYTWDALVARHIAFYRRVTVAAS
jgi:glycosyltransferase involved in cell wall biosynthesis